MPHALQILLVKQVGRTMRTGIRAKIPSTVRTMLTYKLFPDNDAVRGIPENKQKNKWRVMAYTIVHARNIQMLSGEFVKLDL